MAPLEGCQVERLAGDIDGGDRRGRLAGLGLGLGSRQRQQGHGHEREGRQSGGESLEHGSYLGNWAVDDLAVDDLPVPDRRESASRSVRSVRISGNTCA